MLSRKQEENSPSQLIDLLAWEEVIRDLPQSHLVEEPLSYLLVSREHDHKNPGYRSNADSIFKSLDIQDPYEIEQIEDAWAGLHTRLFVPESYTKRGFRELLTDIGIWQKYVYPSDHPVRDIDPILYWNYLIRMISRLYGDNSYGTTRQHSVTLDFHPWPFYHEMRINGSKDYLRAIAKFQDGQPLCRQEMGALLNHSSPGWAPERTGCRWW